MAVSGKEGRNSKTQSLTIIEAGPPPKGRRTLLILSSGQKLKSYFANPVPIFIEEFLPDNILI
jgi:hypothetical protein